MPERMPMPGLLGGGWRDLAFRALPRRHHGALAGARASRRTSLAILRYEPGARVPRHRHAGLETIMVLEGTQSDENGDYRGRNRRD